MAIILDDLRRRYLCILVQCLECFAFCLQEVLLMPEESDVISWWAFEYQTTAILKSCEINLVYAPLLDFNLLNIDS